MITNAFVHRDHIVLRNVQSSRSESRSTAPWRYGSAPAVGAARRGSPTPGDDASGGLLPSSAEPQLRAKTWQSSLRRFPGSSTTSGADGVFVTRRRQIVAEIGQALLPRKRIHYPRVFRWCVEGGSGTKRAGSSRMSRIARAQKTRSRLPSPTLAKTPPASNATMARITVL